MSYVIDDSDEIIPETYLTSPEGLVEKNPYEGDDKVGNLNETAAWNSAQTGLISDGMYQIEVLDEKFVKQYKFRIEVKVLQGRSTYTTPTLILYAICPETVGITKIG